MVCIVTYPTEQITCLAVIYILGHLPWGQRQCHIKDVKSKQQCTFISSECVLFELCFIKPSHAFHRQFLFISEFKHLSTNLTIRMSWDSQLFLGGFLWSLSDNSRWQILLVIKIHSENISAIKIFSVECFICSHMLYM